MNEQSILQGPEEAMLLSKMKEIDEWLERYTVPLYFCRKETEELDPAVLQNGSGVLVTIGDVNFILTAGHCVKKWKEFELNHIVIAIEPKKLFIRVTECDFRYKEGVEDFGFLAINPEDLQIVESLSKKCLFQESISVTKPERNDMLITTGFPKLRPPTGILRHIALLGQMSLYQDYRYPEMFKLWVTDENLKSALGSNEYFEPNDSGGMSGGGCWFPGNIGSKGWKPSDILLVGNHFRAGKPDSGGQVKSEMYVSSHLKLIAERISSLKELISNILGV